MLSKYNRPGGSVRVSVTQELEKLLLRVSDTGCGIPEVYQRSIFQPFFRVDKSRSREYGGVGLGLSLVWEIADLHGGSVWVEESSDKGTTIAVGLTQQQRLPKSFIRFRCFACRPAAFLSWGRSKWKEKRQRSNQQSPKPFYSFCR